MWVSEYVRRDRRRERKGTWLDKWRLKRASKERKELWEGIIRTIEWRKVRRGTEAWDDDFFCLPWLGFFFDVSIIHRAEVLYIFFFAGITLLSQMLSSKAGVVRVVRDVGVPMYLVRLTYLTYVSKFFTSRMTTTTLGFYVIEWWCRPRCYAKNRNIHHLFSWTEKEAAAAAQKREIPKNLPLFT